MAERSVFRCLVGKGSRNSTHSVREIISAQEALRICLVTKSSSCHLALNSGSVLNQFISTLHVGVKYSSRR